MSKKTLFVVDAYNLIYRMFYAIPEMTTRHGDPVQAIFGVAKFLNALAADNGDATLVVVTDVGRSFRADLFAEYKWTRERMPDALRSQIDGVFALFDAAGVQILSREWYEADDLIGSIAHQHENDDYQVVIISSDKDLCQFVRDGHVHIYDAMKRKFIKEADVVEKFGIPAHQVCDYLAIVGDSSDNIPGISGFGPKKAVDLLTKYGTLEWIYENISDLTLKMQAVLVEQRENAFLSQKLARIITDLEIENLPDTPFAPGIQNIAYIDILKKYEFRSLIPQGHHVPEPQIVKFDIVEIVTIWWLESLELSIRWAQSTNTPIVISTDSYGKIVVWLLDQIYSIDSQKVDASSFIDYIFTSEVAIIWFDLKADLKRLHNIQKPLQKEVEGQGRLF